MSKFGWDSILLFLLSLFASPAFAQPRVKSITPSTLRGGQYLMQVPVTWELLRSGFNTLDAALEAESFAEIWGLYQVNAYEFYLITPRGKTRFIPLRLHPETLEGTWDTLALDSLQESWE